MTRAITRHFTSTLAAAIFLSLFGAQQVSASDDKEKTELICAEPGSLTYLFAHGMNGHPKDWDVFADQVKKAKKGYGVWRTQVKEEGHIHERAQELAEFMEHAAKKCDTPDKSVIAVGHSMGGLDLRYLVHHADYKNQRNLLKSVYTIATPHLGDPNACDWEGGIHDLCGHPDHPDKDSPMKEFNDKRPYSDFTKHNIDFIAFRYECKENKAGEDGVVPVASQEWKGSGASYDNRGKGWHKPWTLDVLKHKKVYCKEHHGCKPELCQKDEIKHIIKREANR
jgi:pimeloyl-ACP methyl ester carboxylesterase